MGWGVCGGGGHWGGGGGGSGGGPFFWRGGVGRGARGGGGGGGARYLFTFINLGLSGGFYVSNILLPSAKEINIKLAV